MRAHLPSFQVDFLIIQADSLELQASDVFLNKIASDFTMALGWTLSLRLNFKSEEAQGYMHKSIYHISIHMMTTV